MARLKFKIKKANVYRFLLKHNRRMKWIIFKPYFFIITILY